jgi:hypothetical protein
MKLNFIRGDGRYTDGLRNNILKLLLKRIYVWNANQDNAASEFVQKENKPVKKSV